MSLLDLSQVTQTFITILDSRLPTYADWPMATPAVVSAAPPDSVSGNHALSFYLYHVKENAHTKAQDWQTSEDNPIRFKSMGLTLYYIMTPRSNINELQDRAYADQLTMGLALKTLHELPYITDTTVVDSNGGPVIPMPLAMRGRDNRLRLTLRPTPADDAAEYWQAGTQSARLSAYYEVEAVLLEPEQQQSRSGRVFSVGVHTFVKKAPQISGTSNSINFTIPGEAEPRQIDFSPAQVSVGDTLQVIGSDLAGDSATRLLINHSDFVEPLVADTPWDVDSNGSRLTAIVQSNINGQAILPGIYGVLVETVDRRRLPDGRFREFPKLSNQMAFAIAPRVIDITLVGDDFIIQVEGFEPHLIANDEVMLFVGSDRLTRTINNPPLQGEFVTPAAPPVDRDKVIFRLPAGITAGTDLPARLVVRGVESAPRWVVAP